MDFHLSFVTWSVGVILSGTGESQLLSLPLSLEFASSFVTSQPARFAASSSFNHAPPLQGMLPSSSRDRHSSANMVTVWKHSPLLSSF